MDDLGATRETYAAVADEYRRRHADRSVVADLVETFLAALDGDRVLDVGCGPGWESATFAGTGLDVLAVDVVPAFLEQAREVAPDAALARMDMRRLGVADAAVDGVWALASFLHVPRADADATLAEFRRVLRPGGTLFLGVKRGTGTATVDGYEGDRRRFVYYRADALRERVVRAGFVAEEVSDGDWIQVIATA